VEICGHYKEYCTVYFCSTENLYESQCFLPHHPPEKPGWLPVQQKKKPQKKIKQKKSTYGPSLSSLSTAHFPLLKLMISLEEANQEKKNFMSHLCRGKPESFASD